jgi:hypothetical protein
MANGGFVMEFEEQTFEDWLDDTRIRMYEETKDMPEAEVGKLISASAREAAEEYGFQLTQSVTVCRLWALIHDSINTLFLITRQSYHFSKCGIFKIIGNGILFSDRPENISYVNIGIRIFFLSFRQQTDISLHINCRPVSITASNDKGTLNSTDHLRIFCWF